MIPKIIHYCWFGRGPMPKVVTWCIESWKRKCPDYEIKLWNEDNFDVNSVPFVQQAYAMKKWAFVADYVRIYALYHEGGIYLDSDEYVIKNFDNLLNNRVVSSHEYYPGLYEQIRDIIDFSTNLGKGNDKWINNAGLSLCAATLLSEPHHPFIKDCLDYYNTHDFLYQPGNGQDREQIIGCLITKCGIKYGYTYNINNHDLDEGIKVLGPEAFILNSLFFDSNKSYVVHMALNSWKERINQNSWSKKLLRTSPSLSFQLLKASCLLRRIKHLFLSQEERDRRKGNFPEFKYSNKNGN